MSNSNRILKLTEDETIDLLISHLEKKGFEIESICKGQTRGNDIVASKDGSKLVIEAKGARASDGSPTKKRAHFDSGQIKTHFGKAIVKILDEKYLNPNCKFAIAHPHDQDIIRSIGHLTVFLRSLDIIHYWVCPDGSVIEE